MFSTLTEEDYPDHLTIVQQGGGEGGSRGETDSEASVMSVTDLQQRIQDLFISQQRGGAPKKKKSSQRGGKKEKSSQRDGKKKKKSDWIRLVMHVYEVAKKTKKGMELGDAMGIARDYKEKALAKHPHLKDKQKSKELLEAAIKLFDENYK